MADVIDLWSWRKPDRPPSKRIQQAVKTPETVKALPSPSVAVNQPTRQAGAIDNYTRTFLTRLKEGMSASDNPFFMCVNTMDPNVFIPDWLHAQYPRRITIVLQHKYANLIILPSGFSVDLIFGGATATLTIPFNSITAIVDQRAGLGLDRSVKEPWHG